MNTAIRCPKCRVMQAEPIKTIWSNLFIHRWYVCPECGHEFCTEEHYENLPTKSIRQSKARV